MSDIGAGGGKGRLWLPQGEWVWTIATHREVGVLTSGVTQMVNIEIPGLHLQTKRRDR